ncbi:MAG: 4'-phosphopantetheinyl transferase superfamily protein [Opitutaceae bacterium]
MTRPIYPGVTGRVVDAPADVVVMAHQGNGVGMRRTLAGEIAARCGLPLHEVAIFSWAGRRPSVEIRGRPNTRWQVSLSYTRNCTVGALCAGRAIGVDVESIDPEFRWQPIAAEFFPSEVIATWDHLSPQEARRGFFRQWVRWEAALKCRGVGFGAEDLTYEVALDGLELFDLDLGEGYAGCLTLKPI